MLIMMRLFPFFLFSVNTLNGWFWYLSADDERPYKSHIFQELPSDGNPKLDSEVERQSKHSFLADKMVEQTNQSEHSFVKGELNGGRTGQTCIEVTRMTRML